MTSPKPPFPVGPLILKAANLEKLYHDIRIQIIAKSPVIASIMKECSDVQVILGKLQDDGPRVWYRSGSHWPDVIADIPGEFSELLSVFEANAKTLDSLTRTKDDGGGEIGILIDIKEGDVRPLLDRSKDARLEMERLLQVMLLLNQLDVGSSTPGKNGAVGEPPSNNSAIAPRQEGHIANSSRFSIDSVATRDFAADTSRFSVLSTTSSISPTNFEFDQEALNSSSYRQALNGNADIDSDMDSGFSITGSTIRSEATYSYTSSLRPTDSNISLPVTRSTITEPFNLRHIQHIGIDPITGDFTGLPLEWEKILHAEDERARAAAAAKLSSPSTVSRTEDSASRTSHFIKLVVVGDSGKLKQGLLSTYTSNKPPSSDYIPTVFDNYAVSLKIGETPYTLGLFDTTGQESYDRLRPLSYPQTDVFLILISVSNRSHYKSARDTWAPELKHHCPGVPFLIVGIKDGAKVEADEDEDRTLVGFGQSPESFAVGVELARSTGAKKYVECELGSMKGVKDVFDEAIVAALAPPSAPKKSRRSRLNLRLMSRIEED